MRLFQRPPCSFYVFIAQRHVRVFPVKPYTQVLELESHLIAVGQREFLAFSHEITHAVFFDILLRFESKDPFHLYLDGEPVHIPSCTLKDMIAVHRPVAQYRVFDYLVPGCPQMDPACGVGRPVYEKELLSVLSGFPYARISVHILPEFLDILLNDFCIVLRSLF